MEKSQSKVNKQAVVEKEPLTLAKENEDQSKYYLSYPKPPVLDMKSENLDINVVEWTNIPNVSALDDLVTPLLSPSNIGIRNIPSDVCYDDTKHC